MSGTFPTSPAFNSLNISSEQKTITSTTDSGKMFATQVDGQRWKLTASFPPMTRADFMPIYAFIIKQRSQKETFSIIPPVVSNARGTETGTVLVNGSHSAGDTTINIDGMNGTFKAGEFIKFSGSKVYMIVEDASADSNGEATITIEPPLRSALSDNETVTYDSVPFTVRLQNDVQDFNTGTDGLFRFEVDVIEAL